MLITLVCVYVFFCTVSLFFFFFHLKLLCFFFFLKQCFFVCVVFFPRYVTVATLRVATKIK